MTNKEYLDALANDDPRKLAQWFDEEWADADALRARCRQLQAEVLKLRRKMDVVMEVLA